MFVLLNVSLSFLKKKIKFFFFKCYGWWNHSFRVMDVFALTELYFVQHLWREIASVN